MTTEPLVAVEMAPGLWQLPLPIHRHSLGGANAFLIRDGDGYALFDCGAEAAESQDTLLAQLGSLGVPLAAIHTVLLSHGHGDHAGPANALRAQSGAQIVLHERELAFIGYPNASEDDRQGFTDWLHRHGYPRADIDAVLATATVNDRGDRRDATIRPDRILTGGEVLALGPYRFEVLWTPGHTPGSICLVDWNESLLLCGDHILEIVAPNVGLHPLLPDNPLPEYIASIHHLARQQFRVVLPGHGAPIVDLAGRVAELAVRHEDRRAQVLSLLTDAPQSAFDLATQVWSKPGRRNWANMHPHLRRNGVGMLAAHLDLLAREGVGVSERDDAGVLQYAKA
jgi:glyoxylase-like metal-dependent hydrolase (beta-lactamase superfamily II)